MFFHCHPTKKLLCMLPLLQVGRTTQAVHLFTFEVVVSGVEGEDGVGAGQGIPEIALFAFPQFRS